MGALALTALHRLLMLPARAWQGRLLAQIERGERVDMQQAQLSDGFLNMGTAAQMILLVVTATLFLMWIHRLTRVTRALGGDTMRWLPKDAVWAFIIPVVSIARPYQVVRDLHDQLTPELVPEPVAQVTATATDGYRGVTVVEPPRATALPASRVGAWWGAFWVGNVVANIASRQHSTEVGALAVGNILNAVADGIEVVSAVLAVLVVRGMTARLQERFRRMRHAAPEQLAAAGFTVAPPLP